jgi:hypothetical protein
MICWLERPPKEPEGTIPETDIWRAAEPDPADFAFYTCKRSPGGRCLQAAETDLPRRVAQVGVLHPSGHIGLLGIDEEGANLLGPLVESAEGRGKWGLPLTGSGNAHPCAGSGLYRIALDHGRGPAPSLSRVSSTTVKSELKRLS